MCKINSTHLKVLLKKDFLSLWRSKGYLLAFVILPVGLLAAFIAIQNLVDNGEASGNMIYDHFHFTFNKPLTPVTNFFGYPIYEGLDDEGKPKLSPAWGSILRQCGV